MTRCRRRPCPRPDAPVTLPDDNDILSEILLRLPPKPSSLPRASLVCKGWRCLVSEPYFRHQFRARHRNPPIIGFFSDLEGFVGDEESGVVVVVVELGLLEEEEEVVVVVVKLLEIEFLGEEWILVETLMDFLESSWQKMEVLALPFCQATGSKCGKVYSEGVENWVLQKSRKLQKILGQRSGPQVILGYADDIHAMLLWIDARIWMLQLDSLQCKKLWETHIIRWNHPYATIYDSGI
ncbi:unnamed protein product [Urochloa decumbens]|uniref:F-box domain-containing protein n=1 Tax=Urochloa decumbens TaxID=240449 RepID=A0ABC9C0T5_9POAL